MFTVVLKVIDMIQISFRPFIGTVGNYHHIEFKYSLIFSSSFLFCLWGDKPLFFLDEYSIDIRVLLIVIRIQMKDSYDFMIVTDV